MTIAAQTLEVLETGDNSDVTFSFGFQIYANTDIKVYKKVIATGVSTLQTLTTNYSVAITEGAPGGVVTYVVAPTTLQQSRIVCDVPPTQPTSLRTNGKFADDQIEDMFDRITILIQQIEARLDALET